MDSSTETILNLSKLTSALNENNETDIINELQILLAINGGLLDSQNDWIASFEKLLDSTNVQILTLSFKLVAELAKNLENRTKLAGTGLVLKILPKLNISSVELEIQACRALGNLCYECDKVTKLLFDNGALVQITQLLKNNIQEGSNAKPSDENSHYLRNVACGLLFNFLVTNPSVKEIALQLNLLELLENILTIEIKCTDTNDDCITHLLLILSIVLGVGNEIWITENVTKLLIEILRVSLNPDISELCVEILQTQAENDEIKLYLAKHGLCQLMYKLLEKHKVLVNDESSRALMKMVCDLIVLVLTGDESMNCLYDNGLGDTYKYMIDWLESDDLDLQTTGALAIGNFARKDANCIQMVEQDQIVTKLIKILSKHNKQDGDLKLQHALLSALRNLAIPQQNKPIIIKNQFIDIVYPMLDTDQMPVVFKLLGTIRMIIDGQEDAALQLGSDSKFTSRITHWCYNTDHLGVKGESSRLVAWLIKNCKTECERQTVAYTNIINTTNSVKCLIDMIPSQHAVMQNEALLSLNLLVFNYLKQPSAVQLDEELINANLGPNVKALLKLQLEKEVMENLITLLRQLVHFEKVKDHFRESKLNAELRQCVSGNSKLTYLCQQIEQLNIQ